ncbi:MAG: DUF624 domain-containing protein [Anaerolineaceae bacterium]|nr:DUF624 domain-containing protein [Anaerolineaceae bacterium]
MRAAQAFDIIVDSVKLWWKDWANQVLVSLAMVLASLTIVLLPPALFGVYKETLDLVHNTRTGISGWWIGFKQYFLKSLLWGLINLIIALVLLTNLWFYYNSQVDVAPLLVIVSIIMLIFWVVWQFYSLACFFMQEQASFKLAWKNGFIVIIKNPLYTLIISLTMLAILILSFYVYIPLVLGSIPLLTILSLLAVRATIEN